MSERGLITAGQRVAVKGPESFRDAVSAATGERLTRIDDPYDLLLDPLERAPSLREFDPVTRGVWVGPDGALLTSVGGSGFTQLWSPFSGAAPDAAAGTSARVRVSSRWAPSSAERGAARVLRQRNRSLRAQVLLHYPALWSALAVGGMAPLHASVVEVEGVPVLLAGPGGVGKSSLVADALARGARATCDNLGVSDGHIVHGVVEPLRLPVRHRSTATTPASASAGSRAAHGRREHVFTGRLTSLRPALVAVVRRDDRGSTRLEPIRQERAARELVAGTYAAGELQRFWPLVAHLALAGFGPVHPDLEDVADRLTRSLPCYELTLGRPGPATTAAAAGRLASILGPELLEAGSRPRRLQIATPRTGGPS
jgi:hypothetical protein